MDMDMDMATAATHELESWGDVYWQSLVYDARSGAGSDTTDEQFLEADYSIDPVEPGGLDPDLLGELLYLRRVFVGHIRTRGDETNQSQPSGAEVNVSLGINVAEAETENTDQIGTGLTNRGSSDAVKFVDMDEGYVTGAFREVSGAEGTGTGGAGDAGYSSFREVNYLSDDVPVSTGPVLDSTDDLGIRIGAQKDNSLDQARARVYYQLGWRLHEIEQARPRLGL